MKIAILGGSFNPPGLHHLTIVRELVKLAFFDRIIIIPCGPRPDKQSVGDIDSVFRAAMLEITFREFIGKIEFDLNDLEKPEFTRTIDIDKKYSKFGQVWHVVGYDLVEKGSKGKSPIQAQWAKGKELWEKSRFVVIKRKNYNFNHEDMPPNTKLIDKEISGSSTEIRKKKFNHELIDALVAPGVSEYINRYNLYRSRLPS